MKEHTYELWVSPENSRHTANRIQVTQFCEYSYCVNFNVACHKHFSEIGVIILRTLKNTCHLEINPNIICHISIRCQWW